MMYDEGEAGMEKIINIMIGLGDKSHIYKDSGMIIYSLSKYCGWEGTHAYLNEVYHNADFEEYGKLLSTGYVSDTSRQSCIKATKEFIRREIKNYDVAFFFNYGSTNYKLAYLCKKYNPNINVYCKLDMGEGGFNHFDEKNFSRKVKNYLERIKSRYVDLFTVETKHYYEKLKNTQMFAGGE